MRTALVRISLLAAVAFAAALAPPARAGYHIETLDAPGIALAYSINNSGQVAGVIYDESTFLSRGFIYSGGSYTFVDAPEGVNGLIAMWINNIGDAVMYGSDENWNIKGFVLKNGVYTPFSPPGESPTPSAINDNGDVLGTAYGVGDDYNIYAYILSNGTYTPFTVPGAASVLAYGMNDTGGISGSILTPEGYIQGFLYSGGEFTTIFDPDGLVTNTLGLNNNGSVVGSYWNEDLLDLGFVYRDGVYTTINIPGALYIYVHDINDREEIAGYYIDADYGYHAFVGTPVPEPSTITLAVLGFGIVGLAAARRRVRRS